MCIDLIFLNYPCLLKHTPLFQAFLFCFFSLQTLLTSVLIFAMAEDNPLYDFPNCKKARMGFEVYCSPPTSPPSSPRPPSNPVSPSPTVTLSPADRKLEFDSIISHQRQLVATIKENHDAMVTLQPSFGFYRIFLEEQLSQYERWLLTVKFEESCDNTGQDKL